MPTRKNKNNGQRHFFFREQKCRIVRFNGNSTFRNDNNNIITCRYINYACIVLFYHTTSLT